MKFVCVLAALAVSASSLFGSCGALLSAFLGSGGSEPQMQQPTAAVEEVAGCAVYEIEQDDRSFYDEESGLVLIQVSYDVVKLSAPTAAADTINAQILQDCEQFFLRRDDLEDYLDDPFLDPQYPYECVRTASVSNNKNGLLSIVCVQTWFMGGVYNCDGYGMTFDLTTGELVTLADLCPEREGEIREKVLSYVEETYGESGFGNSEETLAAYSLEQIPFYIEDGQIILSFPTYTFASGAAGATVIETGIVID